MRGRTSERSKLSEARKERSRSRLRLILLRSAAPGEFLFLFSLENLSVCIIISATKTFSLDCRPPSPLFTLCHLPARVKVPSSCHRPSCSEIFVVSLHFLACVSSRRYGTDQVYRISRSVKIAPKKNEPGSGPAQPKPKPKTQAQSQPKPQPQPQHPVGK